MKINVPYPVDPRDDLAFDVWSNSGKIGISDCRNAYEVLQDMDRVLQHFGLEVVLFDSGSTDYWFTVEKKE